MTACDFVYPAPGVIGSWYFRKGEKDVSMDPQTRYCVNDGDGPVAAAVLGLGLVRSRITW